MSETESQDTQLGWHTPKSTNDALESDSEPQEAGHLLTTSERENKDLLRTSLILGQGLLLSKYQNSGSKFNSGSFGPSKRSAKGKNDITIKDVESQENILENDGNRDKLHDKGIAMGNIRRTDQVTIDYETASGQDHSQDSW
ncbi:hypothetical protein N7470_003976 [Penicillium chermesinum]|nr:hypothetical protein N7470_003976 [Penicillium chermesinum]